MARRGIGIWFVGAKGGVASTAAVGLIALRKELVVGGHDIRDARLFDEALRMHTESRAIDRTLIERCRSELDAIDKNIRPGSVLNVGTTISNLAAGEVRGRKESPREMIERVQ